MKEGTATYYPSEIETGHGRHEQEQEPETMRSGFRMEEGVGDDSGPQWLFFAASESLYVVVVG